MKVTIGIDEVGRGPIAGPVCVAAFQFKIKNYRLKIKKTELPLRDSKKLTRIQREKWYTHLSLWKKEGIVDFYISYIHADRIDKIGIAPAIKMALSRSLYKLTNSSLNSFSNEANEAKTSLLQPVTHNLLLDGGLYAPKEFKNQKTIIKGDEKKLHIMFASIVAKVCRDRLMSRHAKKFPGFSFDRHVGYGTKGHYLEIQNNGLTPLHRRSFLKKMDLFYNSNK